MPAYKEQQPKPLGEVGSKTTYTIKSDNKEQMFGGKGDFRPDTDFDAEQLRAGIKVEMEHTKDRDKAKEIAKDHLSESKDYYRKLKTMEDKLEDTNKSLQRANSLVKALKTDCEDKKPSLSEEEMDLEKDEDKPAKKLGKVAKALKAAAILGLTRRQRLDTAYRLGLAQGVKAPNTPFATEDLSQTPVKIGITEEQTRPSYEPPVVPVRRVDNNPGYIAPKPCGDHEYKTTTTGPSEAKPIKDR